MKLAQVQAPDASFPLRWSLRVLAAVGSLQLAVVLIACCVGILAWATAIESKYGAAAAHFGIYDTSWFTAINVLLAANVLGAILIRFPWRRRQAGFLVTHMGILVLLAGCLASRRAGVEAQLPVVEGRTAHRAYQDSYHFQLQIYSTGPVATPGESICVPFAAGPFNWDRYASLPWFPWRLPYRSQGTIYDENGIVLDVLDYASQPQPVARVRLTVDGTAKDFETPLASSEPVEASKQCAVVGGQRRVAVALLQDEVDLGFQVRLHRFQRKLDPGASMASHYSSLVDFLDCGDPPQSLAKDVLITLNAPVDFADPVSGRMYRLFQSGYDGPWLPGEPEFDQLAPSDRSREQVYLSRLSVNYDPGRGLKYLGCLLVTVGIVMVYYLRRSLAREAKHEPVAMADGHRVLALLVFFAMGAGVCDAADAERLDWTAWQCLPVFGDGRIVPLDTFARETVETICGRANPMLSLAGAPPRKFVAAEVLFSWLAEPEKWEKTPFLVAQDPELRERILGLPPCDDCGSRLCYATPIEVENCGTLGQQWAELEREAQTQGKKFRLKGVDKRIKELVDAYAKFRLVTFNPNLPQDTPRRFYARVRLAAKAWRNLAGDSQGVKHISRDNEVRRLMVQAGESLQKLIAQVHDDEFVLEKVEPPVVAFCRAGTQLAARLGDPKDKPLAALAADLRRQTIEMHLALYDNGETLRLVPGLSPGALEQNRSPGDDASPWLSFQAMIYGHDDLLQSYPRPELAAVRQAWADVKAAYVGRAAADRATKFDAAMNRFAETLRTLGQQIEPLRWKLPVQHIDEDVIDATAYPPLGSTDVELFYGRLDPFFWSWVVSLAATLCLLLAVGSVQRPMFWLGVTALLIAQVFTATGLGLRGYITGLIPLTGMFETVVFVAFYAALFGSWFTLLPLKNSSPLTRMDLILQRRPFAVAGAIVSFTAVVLAYYAPATVMHRNIGAVAPILRDNFWLAVHVVTIMASYASAAIGLILGNMALGYYLFGRYVDRRPPEACGILAGFTYTAIQITVLLLAAGTILGGLWADKAWGRFWAWDPKETWALISLLVYVVILHARYIGWSRDFGMAVAAVFGAAAILFTWYGVNFLLGSGMHAYGSGAGGQWAVGTAVAVQWLFLLAAGARYLAGVGKANDE